MTMDGLPFWIEALTAALLVAGGLFALLGASSLVRARDFFGRAYGPSMSSVLGLGCVLIGSMIYFSMAQSRPIVHEVLIFLFVMLTSPLATMLLARAALFRRRNAERRAGIVSALPQASSADVNSPGTDRPD